MQLSREKYSERGGKEREKVLGGPWVTITRPRVESVYDCVGERKTSGA
jgi:hypothetical protein